MVQHGVNLRLVETRSVLTNLYEVLLSHTNLVMERRELLMESVLPRLLDSLNRRISEESASIASNSNRSSNSSSDWKFSQVKLMHDIVSIFMREGEK